MDMSACSPPPTWSRTKSRAPSSDNESHYHSYYFVKDRHLCRIGVVTVHMFLSLVVVNFCTLPIAMHGTKCTTSKLMINTLGCSFCPLTLPTYNYCTIIFILYVTARYFEAFTTVQFCARERKRRWSNTGKFLAWHEISRLHFLIIRNVGGAE